MKVAFPAPTLPPRVFVVRGRDLLHAKPGVYATISMSDSYESLGSFRFIVLGGGIPVFYFTDGGGGIPVGPYLLDKSTFADDRFTLVPGVTSVNIDFSH